MESQIREMIALNPHGAYNTRQSIIDLYGNLSTPDHIKDLQTDLELMRRRNQPVYQFFRCFHNASKIKGYEEVHQQMSDIYQYSESPGYNVYVILMDAAKESLDFTEYEEHVDHIGNPLDVNLNLYAAPMIDTLYAIENDGT